MNIVSEYHDTIAEMQRLNKPRSQRHAKLQCKATDLLTKILQKHKRIERKASKVLETVA
jgi:hypothetical protein